MARKYGLLVLGGLLATALLVADAQAQPPGGRGGRGRGMMGGPGFGLMMQLNLVTNADVQKDLDVVDDQKTKLNDLVSQQRTAMQDLFQSMQDLSQEERQAKMQKFQEDFQKKLADILLPKQVDRLKQIQLQAEGPMALNNPDVVKALNLTDDQKEKFKTINEEAQTKNQEALQGLRGQEFRTKMQELNKDLMDKLLAVLTPDQTAQFDKMKGAKVDFDLSTIMRGMMGGGRRGGRGNRGPGPGPGGAAGEGNTGG